jgi:nicotinamidase-related amidase
MGALSGWLAGAVWFHAVIGPDSHGYGSIAAVVAALLSLHCPVQRLADIDTRIKEKLERRVLESARQSKVRTFFTRHMSLPRELMGSMQYRTAMAWQHADHPAHVKSPFLRESPGFAIVPELQPLESEAVFDKITMSAFEGTPLTIALRDCGVRAVVIVGIATEIGIEPTARHAADLGFVPILARDACGHGKADAAERSWQSLAFAGDSIITDVARVCAAWLKRGEPLT